QRLRVSLEERAVYVLQLAIEGFPGFAGQRRIAIDLEGAQQHRRIAPEDSPRPDAAGVADGRSRRIQARPARREMEELPVLGIVAIQAVAAVLGSVFQQVGDRREYLAPERRVA